MQFLDSKRRIKIKKANNDGSMADEVEIISAENNIIKEQEILTGESQAIMEMEYDNIQACNAASTFMHLDDIGIVELL